MTLGNGNDNIQAGNGDNLIAAGLGQHTVQAGDDSNILIDASLQLMQSGNSLRQVLDDWILYGDEAANVGSIRSRLSVTGGKKRFYLYQSLLLLYTHDNLGENRSFLG